MKTTELSALVRAAALRQALRLVDTPGIGSVHRHNTDVTYWYVPQEDAVIFVAPLAFERQQSPN
jgi:hypothetical protein